jgi:hypothetical protein
MRGGAPAPRLVTDERLGGAIKDHDAGDPANAFALERRVFQCDGLRATTCVGSYPCSNVAAGARHAKNSTCYWPSCNGWGCHPCWVNTLTDPLLVHLHQADLQEAGAHTPIIMASEEATWLEASLW